MSSYPINPKYEEWLSWGDGTDAVGVWKTHDDLIVVAAPYMDVAVFDPHKATAVCEAIMRAVAADTVPQP